MSDMFDDLLGPEGGDDVRMVAPRDLHLEDRYQPRDELDREYVDELADLMEVDESGRVRSTLREFDPIEAVEAEDGRLIVWDGFHRTKAARKAKISKFQVRVQDGTPEDAYRKSLGANAAHGRRRSDGTLRKQIWAALLSDEFGQWTDSRIADEVVFCSQSKVQEERSKLEATRADYKAPDVRIDKRGREMNTANIGSRKKPQVPGRVKRRTNDGDEDLTADSSADSSGESKILTFDNYRHERVSAKTEPEKTKSGEPVMRQICSEFQPVLESMPDESIDLIITRGTKRREHYNKWDALAEQAQRILTKNGLVVAFAQDHILHDVYTLLNRRSLYHWWYWTVVWDGDPVEHFDRSVPSSHSIAVVFARAGNPDPPLCGDVFTALRDDKGWRDVTAEIIRRADISGTALDPMCGTGELALGAKDGGMSVIAIDENREKIGKFKL